MNGPLIVTDAIAFRHSNLNIKVGQTISNLFHDILLHNFV